MCLSLIRLLINGKNDGDVYGQVDLFCSLGYNDAFITRALYNAYVNGPDTCLPDFKQSVLLEPPPYCVDIKPYLFTLCHSRLCEISNLYVKTITFFGEQLEKLGEKSAALKQTYTTAQARALAQLSLLAKKSCFARCFLANFHIYNKHGVFHSVERGLDYLQTPEMVAFLNSAPQHYLLMYDLHLIPHALTAFKRIRNRLHALDAMIHLTQMRAQSTLTKQMESDAAHHLLKYPIKSGIAPNDYAFLVSLATYDRYQYHPKVAGHARAQLAAAQKFPQDVLSTTPIIKVTAKTKDLWTAWRARYFCPISAGIEGVKILEEKDPKAAAPLLNFSKNQSDSTLLRWGLFLIAYPEFQEYRHEGYDAIKAAFLKSIPPHIVHNLHPSLTAGNENHDLSLDYLTSLINYTKILDDCVGLLAYTDNLPVHDIHTALYKTLIYIALITTRSDLEPKNTDILLQDTLATTREIEQAINAMPIETVPIHILQPVLRVLTYNMQKIATLGNQSRYQEFQKVLEKINAPLVAFLTK